MNRLIVALLLFVVSLSAAAIKPGAVKHDFDGETLRWKTNVPYESATLVLVGPGDYTFAHRFGPDDALELKPFAQGKLTDGRYAFELVLKPRSAGRHTGAAAKVIDRASGSFRVLDGLPVDAAEPEVLAKVQVISDNLIVNGSGTGSLCVGSDCAPGEVFGLDAIRLKENNLRIHFDDTSNSASFPANDWRIEINDTTNGGDEYFAISNVTAGTQPFRIDEGAGEASLRIDGDGEVGMGTTIPMANLHIVGSDTPSLRIEQDSSAGFPEQVWELRSNELEFSLEDVTAGTTPISVTPGANEVTIDGDLVVTGGITPDYVFSPAFRVPTIEEHANAMWTNSHLPFVAPAGRDEATEGARINVAERSQSVLKELEIAHIYIEQLHSRLEQLEERLNALED